MVPDIAGKVTPPVVLLTPIGDSITVPPTPPTATLPKFISEFLTIAIGIIIFTLACAYAL
jgi:hypothetical protein